MTQKELDKTLAEQAKTLRSLYQEAWKVFMSRSERWQESAKGKAFEERCDRFLDAAKMLEGRF